VLFRSYTTHLPAPMPCLPHEAAAIKKTNKGCFNVFFSKPVGKATQMTGGGTMERPPRHNELTAFQQGFFAERKEIKGTKNDRTGRVLAPRMFLPY